MALARLQQHRRHALTRLLQILAVQFLMLFLSVPALAQPVAEPSPGLSPREVVEIQLEALGNNDEPTRNAGIEQVWEFAHPANRSMTGPLERFTRMIQGRGYETLINHRSYELREISTNEEAALYAVRVLGRDGSFYDFAWRLRTAEIEAGEVWMTTSVSPGRVTGEQLSMRLNSTSPTLASVHGAP